MNNSGINFEAAGLEVKFASTQKEINQAQNLRYKVFFEEMGAKPSEKVAKERRDFDEFDEFCDHLLVIDKSVNKVIGTYRMMDNQKALEAERFYTEAEFDISKLKNTGKKILELGRSCVHKDYRSRIVLKILWDGIANCMIANNIDYLIGCASIHGLDLKEHEQLLSYLYHNHLALEEICPKAINSRAEMNIIPKDKLLDAKEIIKIMPPLIKGYLRVGCMIGDGAFVDYDFNSVDVAIILDAKLISSAAQQIISKALKKDE